MIDTQSNKENSAMTLRGIKLLTGAAVLLVAGFAAVQPSVARPSSAPLLSQVNVPEREGVPQLTTEEVRGRITSISGDQVQVRLASGEVRTYTITASEQQRNQLRVGGDVALTVRQGTVVAINNSSIETTESTQTSGTVQSGQTSSTTVIRRETTVRTEPQVTQTSPAPATTPATTGDDTPAAQPVRGLW
jgi:hypothetical protein